jgi:outer membrane lipoprotein-sorting protein
MRFRAVTIIIIMLVSGCSLRFRVVDKPESIAHFLDKIHAHNESIKQIKAHVLVKASGIMGGFIHEEADLIVRAPKYVYWSLRSFFGPPSIILTSNGEFITVYDFTGQSATPYQKTPLKEDSFFEIMDFDLHPQSLINLFLTKVALLGARNLELKTLGDRLEIHAELENNWRMKSLFDYTKNRVLETRLTNNDLSMSYQANYHDYQEFSGIYFPKSIVLMAKKQSRFARLNIHFLTIELNGELVSPDRFYLAPH